MDFVDRLFDELNRLQMGEPVEFALTRVEFLAIVNDPGVQALIRLKLRGKNDPAFAEFLKDYLTSVADAFEVSARQSDENISALEWLVDKGFRVAPLAGGGMLILGLFGSAIGVTAGGILIFGGIGALCFAGVARWEMARARRRATDAATRIRRFVDGL